MKQRSAKSESYIQSQEMKCRGAFTKGSQGERCILLLIFGTNTVSKKPSPTFPFYSITFGDKATKWEKGEKSRHTFQQIQIPVPQFSQCLYILMHYFQHLFLIFYTIKKPTTEVFLPVLKTIRTLKASLRDEHF